MLHTFEYYDKEHEVALKGKSRIITLELSKLEKVWEKPVREMSEVEKWGVFFRYLTDKGKREKINEIVEREEGIAMASEVLLNISRDEVERARLTSEMKYELDTQSRIAYAKKQGKREGIEEGMQRGMQQGKQEGVQQGKREIALSALKMGMNVEGIAQLTGLAIEEIKSLS